MKKISMAIVGGLMTITASSFGATLHSLSTDQIKQAFVNKTLTSIPAVHIDQKIMDNTVNIFMDDKGHIMGKFMKKPDTVPQTDSGDYTVNNAGDIYITWQHWHAGKQFCVRLYDTQNAYVAVDCSDVFHTAFIKSTAQTGNHL
jgi:hypothetical protein